MELALQEQKRANEDLKQELKDQDELIGKPKVVYMSSKILQLTVGSRDLSQASGKKYCFSL